MNSNALKGYLRRELKKLFSKKRDCDWGRAAVLEEVLEWVERRLDEEQEARARRAWTALHDDEYDFGTPECTPITGWGDRFNGNDYDRKFYETDDYKVCLFFARRTGYCAANGGKCVHQEVKS